MKTTFILKNLTEVYYNGNGGSIPGLLKLPTNLERFRYLTSIRRMNLAAQSLGRLARGKPKNYSAAELALRSERLKLARLKRWPLKRKP